jgi:hypothetical protein
MAGSWNLEAGLNHVGAYQVSGRPFASGSINAKHGLRPGGHEIQFPYVAKWFKVINNDETNICKVAFSVSGMTGSNNFFTVDAADFDAFGAGNSGVLDLKVSSIWISGSTDVDVVAGLTTINKARTATDAGINWSGSSGVG